MKWEQQRDNPFSWGFYVISQAGSVEGISLGEEHSPAPHLGAGALPGCRHVSCCGLWNPWVSSGAVAATLRPAVEVGGSEPFARCSFPPCSVPKGATMEGSSSLQSFCRPHLAFQIQQPKVFTCTHTACKCLLMSLRRDPGDSHTAETTLLAFTMGLFAEEVWATAVPKSASFKASLLLLRLPFLLPNQLLGKAAIFICRQ